METVTFKLETFEGPLDLLLHLIQKNKVSITDIPIADITKQYLDYLNEMKNFDMEITGEFLVMAAQLLYIKSKMLLPDDDEDEDEGDPRAELVDRLIEYAKYKNAVDYLQPRQNMDKLTFYKTPDDIEIPKVRYVETQIPVSRLLEAMAAVLERNERKAPIKKEYFEVIVKRESVTVASRITFMFSAFKNRENFEFEEIFEEVFTRPAAVSTFLAVLELMRRGNLEITEENDKLICRLSGDESEFESIDSDY
ncbi:MAG: segregation/condensation protein A [Clostridia bacterium]|nr:segregation/condensation protein A [Clostridia bacterium]